MKWLYLSLAALTVPAVALASGMACGSGCPCC
jgi:hypothetical protein